MKPISHLVYYDFFKNHVIHDFMKSVLVIFDDYLDVNDRPVIEAVNASNGVLSNYVSALRNDFTELTNTLNVPRKFLTSSIIEETNAKCILLFGDIKRLVAIEYNNTKSSASEIMNNEIRMFKNLRTLSFGEVLSNLSIFLKKMDTEEFKPHCTSLKLTEFISNLTEEYETLNTLILERKEKKESTVYSAKAARQKCKVSYYNLIEYTNSMITFNSSENFDGLKVKLNSLINPLNKYSRSYIARKEDEPLM